MGGAVTSGSALLLTDPQSLPTLYKEKTLNDFRASTGFSPETLLDTEACLYSSFPKELQGLRGGLKKQT